MAKNDYDKRKSIGSENEDDFLKNKKNEENR